MNYTVLFGFFKTIISHSKRLEVDGSKTSIIAKIYPKGASLLSFPSFILFLGYKHLLIPLEPTGILTHLCFQVGKD